MTKREDCIKNGNFKNNHCSAMLNIAWCNINNNYNLRLHDYCPNPKCSC